MFNPQLLPGKRSSRFFLIATICVSLGVFVVFAWSPTTRATRSGSKAPAGADSKGSRHEIVPGDVLVRYRNDAVAKTRQLATNVATASGRTIPMRVDRFEGSDVVAGLRLAHVSPEETWNAIAALKAQPDVLYAEPNYVVHTNVIPNDTSFGSLYGLTKIGAPTAWNSTTGSSAIVVGDIDEGIDISHPDLLANIWTNPAPDSIPGITGDLHGYDFLNNSGTISAEFHGTHTAGTIGAVGNNGMGVVGVNWTVKLMSLKFLGATGGSNADAIRACSYAKQMRDLWVSSGGTKGANVRVLNNSYGGGGFDRSFFDVISALNQSGILFVAAAGNFPEEDGIDNDLTPHYPASYTIPNVISVAATDQSDALAPFSHYGAQTVDLGAPGVGILSTIPGANYNFADGTSMATPHVTGAAALLWAQNPNLTVQQVKSLLLFNGDPLPFTFDRTHILSGRRLNVANSLATLALNDTTAPGTATSFQITSQSARVINLGWTTSGDNGATGQAALYQITFTDAATGAVVPLQSFAPPTSGTAQTLQVKVPLTHNVGTITLREFDKAGNEGAPTTVNVSIPFVVGNPYASAIGKSVGLSTGGTPLGLNADDGLKTTALPFAFPFFGQNFNSVIVSTNGNLYFSTPPTRSNGEADDATSSSFDLTQFKMISGLWDDLRTDTRAGDDVYVVTPDSSRIIFRWQGVTFDTAFEDGTSRGEFPVNFEVELRSNGTIQSRYGAGNTFILPVVGISGGEPDAYFIPELTSENAFTNLTNAQQVTYIPRSVMNPDDNVDFFVSQHYRDFLSRGPDPGGEAFWIDQIAGNATNTPPPCANGDVNCLNTRRISVSNSFFYSLEFQQAGAYAFRLYRESFGNSQPFPVIDSLNQPEANKLPDYAHFNPDSQLVVGGANLSQEQQDLANAFALRPEFISKYPANVTLDQFVTAILANIQTDSGANLTALHNSLVALGTRGAVLYRLANDDLQGGNGGFNNRALIDAEYNRAFVYTQYAGYFRRNPDIGGFLFWFGQVNSGPLRDTTKQLALVCSQITSGEYQLRFSTIISHNNNECPQ